MIFIYSQSLILFWFIMLSILHCLQNLREVRLSSCAKKKETDIKDVTLYYYNRQKFFRLVGFACASQFIFWSWMAYFNLSQVKLADLVNLKRNRSQDEILDVTSKSKVHGKLSDLWRSVITVITIHIVTLSLKWFGCLLK